MCIFLKLCLLPIGQKHFQIVNQILGNPRRKKTDYYYSSFINDLEKDIERLFLKRNYVGKSRMVMQLKTILGLFFLCRFLDAKKQNRQEGCFFLAGIFNVEYSAVIKICENKNTLDPKKRKVRTS